MLTKKEIVWVIIAIIIFEFIIQFNTTSNNPLILLIPLIIILTNIFSKKIASTHYSIEIEHKIWEFQRYGLYRRSRFKRPFPIGLLLPFFLTVLSLGFLKPLALLQFNAKNMPQRRLLKKQGARRATKKTEINEEDFAYTASWGFYSLLLLVIIGTFIRYSLNIEIGAELAKYSIYYGIWNLLPISNLDGAKLFFGQNFVWTFITILYLIALAILFVIL